MVRSKASALVESLSHIGPEQSVDLDNAGMRLALDVVALVMPPSVSQPANMEDVSTPLGCTDMLGRRYD